MVKTVLRDTYLGTTTPTEMQIEVAIFQKVYYDKDNHIMINQLVNEFYTRFLFKIDSLPQEVELPLDITKTFFNNLSPDVREFLISEGVQVPQTLPTETIHNQGSQRILLVINTDLEVEKKITTKKSPVQPEV